MDWGIAKLAEKAGAGAKPEHETPRGELVGTPAYMSPEQASGEVRDIDARSDLYGATVLFHELLAVKHYLAHCKELRHLLMSVLAEEFSYLRLAFLRHPGHPVPAAELLHFIVRGLQKDPGERYQNAAEMIGELQHIRDGHCRVSCPATLAKRMSNGVGHFVSHYPKLSPFVFYSVLLFVICYMTMTTYLLLARVG